MKIKAAAVSFINAAPLWWEMKDNRNVELLLLPPAETTECLLEGSVDIAIVPTYEFVMNNFFQAAPLGVLSNGDVRSVLLFHPSDIELVRKIYLDPASRTSQAMTRFLFSDKGIVFETARKELKDLAKDEGQLLIGDDALKLYDDPMPKVDIATFWKIKTSHSALFALWAKKNEKLDLDEADFLESAFSRSLSKFDDIIKWAGARTGLSEPLLRHYFEKSLFYSFGEKGEKALHFYQEVFL
jgi:cyclic dehypoxanthinyl futalosine synthase